MPSGFSFSGGRPRCFVYWQEFSKCYAQSDNPIECKPQSEDYLECLHHPRELARAKFVQQEFVRQAENAAKEGRKVADILADGTIVGVGLIARGKAKEN